MGFAELYPSYNGMNKVIDPLTAKHDELLAHLLKSSCYSSLWHCERRGQLRPPAAGRARSQWSPVM
jgi:hypothetical protein